MIQAEILQNHNILIKENTVSDSVKFETVRFKFPKSWENYKKTAVFTYRDEAPVSVILDVANELCISENECYIPFEVLKYDGFQLSVFGVCEDSVATTTRCFVRVLQSGYAEGDVPAEPTPTEYQQLITLNERSMLIAQSVRRDADSGLFKGDRGDKGEKGEKGEKGDKGDIGEVSLAYANATFAPAIRNTASGKGVTVRDVATAAHPLDISVDSSGVTVTRYGKNFVAPFRAPTPDVGYYGITFTNNPDGSITANGTAKNTVYYWYSAQNSILLPAGTYTFSAGIGSENSDKYYVGFMHGNDEAYHHYKNTFTITEPTLCGSCIAIMKGATVNNLTFYPQVEVGTAVTEYEPYVVPQSEMSDENGKVEGLISPASTVMSLVSDNKNAVINVTYNADTKRYIDNLISGLK